MKKALLMVLATLLFSCSSNDEEINNSTREFNETMLFRTVNNDDIKSLAEKIYYDVDFNNYAQIQFEISEKLNLNANIEEIASLKTDEELNEWVSININKTNFTSELEYNTINQELELLKMKFLNKFETDLEDFRDFENFNKILEEELYKIAENDNTDQNRSNCYTRANNCIRRARNNAAAGMAASIVTAYFNPIIGAAGGIASYIYLQSALEACQDSLDACLGN